MNGPQKLVSNNMQNDRVKKINYKILYTMYICVNGKLK